MDGGGVYGFDGVLGGLLRHHDLMAGSREVASEARSPVRVFAMVGSQVQSLAWLLCSAKRTGGALRWTWVSVEDVVASGVQSAGLPARMNERLTSTRERGCGVPVQTPVDLRLRQGGTGSESSLSPTRGARAVRSLFRRNRILPTLVCIDVRHPSRTSCRPRPFTRRRSRDDARHEMHHAIR